jgi:hypothetical protein
MAKKLQNIDAINKMLVGEHQFQTNRTTSFATGSESTKKRFVGETWEETDKITGITYVLEQKDGYAIKNRKGSDSLQTTRDYLVTFNKCPKETCTCISPTHLDKKMKTLHNQCYDCVIEQEHRLRLKGGFNTYAIDRMKSNAIEWLKRAERDVELLKQAYTTSYDVVINPTGNTETVAARMTPEEFSEKVEREFQEYRENFMLQLTNMENSND